MLLKYNYKSLPTSLVLTHTTPGHQTQKPNISLDL